MIVNNSQTVIDLLLANKIGIMPTDTVYGMVTLFQNFSGLQRLFAVKDRTLNKKMPILVASWAQMAQFIDINNDIVKWVENAKEPTTIIYQWKNNYFQNLDKRLLPYLSDKTVALRFVNCPWLQNIILQTGPIFATSCNLSGKPPIYEFHSLLPFEQQVDFIYQRPTENKKPSRLFNWTTQSFIKRA